MGFAQIHFYVLDDFETNVLEFLFNYIKKI